MSSWINYNGTIIPNTTNAFNFMHSAILNGDVVVESIRLLNDNFLFSERHYFHLMAQMRMARMSIPMEYTPNYFYEALALLKDKVGVSNALFHFNVTENGINPEFWIRAKELPSDELFYSNSSEIELYKESHVDNSFLNRINFARPQNRILTTYAKENHFDDLILLNNLKSIARSIYGNIFMVKDGQLFTPTLEHGAYDDVLRDRVITACKRMPHFEMVHEVEIFPFKLTKADELFIVQNGEGIRPVKKFRKTIYKAELASAIPEYLLELN